MAELDLLGQMYRDVLNGDTEGHGGGTRPASDAAAFGVRAAQNSAYELTDRMDKLVLVCQAIWSLLMEHTELTEADLLQRVTDLDLKDGQLDGKIIKGIVKCKKCDSAISHKFSKCLFCGQQYETESAFTSI